MANFEECKASLLAELNANDFHYDEHDETLITFGMSGDNVKSVRYFITFDKLNDSVNITGMNIASFRDKIAQGFVMVNRLNLQYRWIKFVIHDNGDLITEMDAVIEPGTAGKEIMELVARNMHILDEAYPEIMKEIWR